MEKKCERNKKNAIQRATYNILPLSAIALHTRVVISPTVCISNII